ncbi:MAG TPA: 30S ribosomal protein S20 [Candidatus Udaeobacter sp.]|nr:30S ribosomal protein S20 [Candidatus Udaeobacter sp.]
MPHHKSAEKRMRTSDKARLRNRAVKSTMKSALKKFDEAPGAKSAEALREATAELDRAAKKGVIPKGRADRKKSRLAKQANRNAAKG